jgi:hypothetical protein
MDHNELNARKPSPAGPAEAHTGDVRHYVSLCSQGYAVYLLAQQMALREIESVPAVCHVLCMDRGALRIFSELDVPGMRPTLIEDFADAPLLACKDGRTLGEYCWTAKPRFLLWVLAQNPDVGQALYVDTDLFPFADLDPVWAQLAEADVLLFPHRFPPRLMHFENLSGHYNAGMVGARNTPAARQALAWWAERCLEWCFYRAEDGKLADQRYLERFPTLFAGVRDCLDEGVNVAPWNVERYAPAARDGAVWLDGQTPLRLYHFHQYKLLEGRTYRAVSDPVYAIAPEVRRLLYEPYTRAMDRALALARTVVPGLVPGS